MKKLLTILLIFTASICQSQNIGDKLEYLLDNKKEFNLVVYRIDDNYFELVSNNDSVIIVYLMDFKRRKVFGIDYLYPDGDRLNTGLKIALNEAYEIGDRVWMVKNNIIIARETEIIVRDVRYLRKYRKK